MKPQSKWTTRRVVVEVPVSDDSYTEKDLRWDVANLVEGSQLNRLNKQAVQKRIYFGKVEVKQFDKLIASRMKRTVKLVTSEPKE